MCLSDQIHRILITLTVESSTMSIDENITENIIRTKISVLKGRNRTEDGAFMNTNIDQELLQRLPIKNHLKLFVAEK